MISYNDLDFAITRWKARVGGAPQAAPTPASGMVQAEVPVSTAPEAEEPEVGALAEEAQATISSGLVMAEDLLDTQGKPEPDQK